MLLKVTEEFCLLPLQPSAPHYVFRLYNVECVVLHKKHKTSKRYILVFVQKKAGKGK